MANLPIALRLPYDVWEPIAEALKDGDLPRDTIDFTRDVCSLSATCLLLRQYLGPFLYKEILLRGPHSKAPSQRDFRVQRFTLSSAEHTLGPLKEHSSLRSIVARITLQSWMCHIEFAPEEDHIRHQRILLTVFSLLPTLDNLTFLGLMHAVIPTEGHDALRRLAKLQELVLSNCPLWPCSESARERPSLLCVRKLCVKFLRRDVILGPSSFANSSRLQRLECDSIPLLYAIYHQIKHGKKASELTELVISNHTLLEIVPPGTHGMTDASSLVLELLSLCPLLRRLELPEWMTFSMHGLCTNLRSLKASTPIVTTASWRYLTEIYASEYRNSVTGDVYADLTALVAAAYTQSLCITSFVYVCTQDTSFVSVVDICAPLFPRLRKFGISALRMPDTINGVFDSVSRHREALADVREMHFSYLTPDVKEDDIDVLLDLCLDMRTTCPNLWKVSIGMDIDCMLADDGEWTIM